MTYPSINYPAHDGQVSFFYLIFGRKELSRELALQYWTNPHATLVARVEGTHQYRTHLLDVEHVGGWPLLDGVQTDFPDGWRPDGIVEATVLDPASLAPSPRLDSILHDEQNFLGRGLPYFSADVRWHRSELAPVGADLQRPETRMLVLLRRRNDVSQEDFAAFIQKDLIDAITQSSDIVEAKSLMFGPYDAAAWPAVGLSHEHPADQQYHAGLVLAGVNRIAVMEMFRSKAFQATLAQQSKMFECVHSIEAENTVSMVEEGQLQTAALRGFDIARIFSRIGATSQTVEPVLSRVLTSTASNK